MYAKELIKTIDVLLNLPERRSIMLWSDPGMGKSSIVRFIAERRKIGLIDVRLLLLNPVDLRGLPKLEKLPNGKVVALWSQPIFLPIEEHHGAKGILFLDELPSADRMTQAAAYSLTLDYKCGEYEVPKGWRIIAAGNPETSKAIYFKMPTPLRTRFIHLELEPDLDSWKEWALRQGINGQIIAFLNMRPELLFKLDDRARTFSCPRSWQFLSEILDQGIDSQEVIAGTVGEGPAIEFKNFLNIYKDLPKSAEEVLRQKLKFTEPSRMYATVGMVVSHYARYHNESKVAQQILRYSYELNEEFAVLMVKDCMRASDKICDSAEWRKWCEKFQEVVLPRE